MEWMQALAIIVSMFGMIGGLGFFFLKAIDKLDKSIDRIDRNYEIMQKEMKDFHTFMREIHSRISVLEDRKTK